MLPKYLKDYVRIMTQNSRDFKIPPRSSWELHSSGLLRSEWR